MLLRFLVAMLCVAWGTAEFQCPGPGRFSTSPGLCTNEYYTCNREPNKDYIAYVLSCPGHTLFNERTRRCSNAKTVFCTVASNTNQTGLQSSPVKVTTTTRSQMLKTRTSPGLFANRIYSSSKATTKRKTPVYRKPGQPSRFTWKPFRVTVTKKTKPKTQVNQWRIRQSTTKRKSTPAWIKTSPLVTQTSNMLEWTTNTANFRTSTRLFQRMSPTIPYKTADISTQKMSTTDVVNHIQLTSTTLTSANPNQIESISAFPKPIFTESTHSLQIPSFVEPGSKLTEYDKKYVKHTNAQYTAKILGDLSGPKNATTPYFMTTPSSQQEGYHSQITVGYVTKPTMMSTTPITPVFHNAFFETTPEAALNDYDRFVPFMDSLESTENDNVMKVVFVTENSHSVPSTTITQRQRNKDNEKITKSQIQYFYDQDVNNTGNSSSLGVKETKSKFHSIPNSDYSLYKGLQMSKRKLISRKRQPKQFTGTTNGATR